MAGKPSIGIIGEGEVGSQLKKGLERADYRVSTAGHDAGEVEKLARRSDILVLAVPHDQLDDVIKECGDAHKGKTLVDVTNVVDEEGRFAGSLRESQAERLQALAPDCHVVKAFNTVFAPAMATGRSNGDRLSVFVAGDDEKSRHMIERLGADIGFDAVDTGPLANARYLETLGFLNMTLGLQQGMGNQIGFRLVHP